MGVAVGMSAPMVGGDLQVEAGTALDRQPFWRRSGGQGHRERALFRVGGAQLGGWPASWATMVIWSQMTSCSTILSPLTLK
jgi:hypothetical protein